jgi:anti-sigma factor RsiW
MNDMFTCGDRDALVSYLYDECEPQQRRAISAHVAMCAACASEVAGLTATREHLALWSPPDAQLGFKIVSGEQESEEAARSNVLRPPRWWRQPLPAWAQAAAAVLIFGTGMTLGALRNVAVRGSAASAPQVVASAPQAAASSTTPVTTADLAALEQRLRGEMSQIRATGTQVAASGPVGAGDAQVLVRVRQMIDDSEQRQRRELALRTAQLVRDLDAQRNDDVARIERTIGQMDGTTGAEVAQQRQVLNYLMRVSQRGQ